MINKDIDYYFTSAVVVTSHPCDRMWVPDLSYPNLFVTKRFVRGVLIEGYVPRVRVYRVSVSVSVSITC